MCIIRVIFLPAIRVMVILCWQISTTKHGQDFLLNYRNGPTGRTTTEGSSMSVSGMGCWNTAPGTGQRLGKTNFETSMIIERHW